MTSSRTLVMEEIYTRFAPKTICSLPQMLPEKLRRTAPGELGGFAVVHGLALLVDEGVLGVIAEQLQRLAGGLHALFEGIDHLRRAPVVLVGEVSLERNLDIGGLGRLLRRD